MKKSNILLLAFCIFFNVTAANAQFNKPIQSSYSRKQSTDANWNIGLTGGLSLTQWLHFGGTHTQYKQPIDKSIGYSGGLAIEKKLDEKKSITVEAIYAMRNLELTYDLNLPGAIDQWNDITKTLDASYTEVIVQTPYTHYLGNPSNSAVTPYVFAAPRVSIPLNGKTLWTKENHTTGTVENDTVDFNSSNYAPFNIGVVAGAGLLFRLNTNSYYFLIKMDASYHAGLVNTFSRAEREGTITDDNVIGAGYIDPALLGRRFAGDANLKLTLLFPLKKQLKGACISWGEYD